ncbi:MAG: hypothetical protein LBM93_13035 [Oscillospiraceae bacterium]|jgi:hypothetical protein|nr:hypothetical protein [Oscillospiraceae bacterium]
MNDAIQRGICFKWNNEKIFDFLRLGSSLIFNEIKDGAVAIEIYINTPSFMDDTSNNIPRILPSTKTGFDGTWNGLYISYYFEGKIFIVTNMEKGITTAKIHPSYSEKNKRLFLTSLLRNHIIRHLIYNGYFVYHASAISERSNNNVIMILGESGSGKTTFALEAVKSNLYNFISEDKVVINPQNNTIFGSSIIHLKEDSKNKYNNFVGGISLINGGTTEKKYEAYIPPSLFAHSGELNQIIILNQGYFLDTSFCRKLTDVKSIKSILDISQRNLYLSNEKQIYEQACNKLLEMPIYELYRKNKINFQVYMERA